MNRGKSLKIFLLDGIPNGRWICELSNWTGKAFRIPRTSYKLCKDREELRSPSIYFLFGHDNDSGEPVIYVGETEDAIKRLGEHIQDPKKDYWTDTIVFITKDDHLNKAHIKYLESRFYELAKEVGRYAVKNLQPPRCSVISEAEIAEMEEFIDNVKIVVSALGHKVFEMLMPVRSDIQVSSDANEVVYLYIKNRNGVSAKGFQSPEGFVVCKGSVIREQLSTNSLNKNIIKLREQYLSDGTIVDNTFIREILFTSPSAASDFILGNSTSGPVMWKNEEGITLKELNERESNPT
ncbi:GIY-YIG nuclease family protein [Ruminiclostridium papyrosolvens]|uniref:DUF4357 domain-containing protein n=1 Tax=Ruminiclostridium papyrosolvens C7 TaxID=1330534 RepID=U4QX79_9FIRM|nr:GIY-YIG nuclease family protein [Ruminiclostridium papyrosolvens]EPR08130.1 hypothetical protein L323_18620 [Ruminiclostridium papyrosolvens C7]